MEISINKNIENSLAGTIKKLLLPSLLLILMVSTAIAFQTLYYNFPGKENVISFLRIFASELIDSLFYFLLIPAAYYILKLKSRIQTGTLFLLYSFILLFFVCTHQLTAHLSKTLLLGSYYKFSFTQSFTGGTLIWLDLVIFISFIIGLNLIENIFIEKEIKLQYSMLEMQLVKSKLRKLRGNIHPQFIFKILDRISGLISAGKNKEANRVLSSMSNFLRTTIYDNEQDEIPLSDELYHLNLYLDVENIAETRKILVEENIDKRLYDCLIPDFLFQPLIENIIENLADKSSNVNIALLARDDKGRLELAINTCAVINDISLLIEGKPATITKERLNNLYGHEHTFEINEIGAGAVVIKISIPLSRIINYNSIQGEM